jgi:hypothetical protein
MNDLHARFEQAFRERVGQVFSRQEIKKILQDIFKDLPDGSVVPTDHAEPAPHHVNQCRKCADPRYRIFDTEKDGQGASGIARYRVRGFEPFPTSK